MAEIDYRDIPAPGMGVGAGMMRAMRRAEPAPSAPPRGAALRLVGAAPDPADHGVPGSAPDLSHDTAPRPVRETVRTLFRSTRNARLAADPYPAAGAAWSETGAPDTASAIAAQPRGERMQRLVNGTGALVSLLLVAGLGYWGYRLAVRDVTGIPVIRALEGPARVAPEDPGGELARHQGLSVNDVTADGTAAPAPDRLMLAPKPEGLSDEDLAMSAMAEGAGAAGAALSIEPAATPTEPLTGQPLGPDGVLDDPALAPVTADSLAPARPEMRPLPRPGARSAALAPAADTTAAEDADVAAALAAAEASITPQTTEEIDAATLPPGTRLVQIDTYDSVDAARAGWDAIAEAYPDVMTGKRRVIEAAGDSGTSFFRLRAEGFADVEDARRFCSVLKPRVPTCVPALVK
jgi:hypothetical protein